MEKYIKEMKELLDKMLELCIKGQDNINIKLDNQKKEICFDDEIISLTRNEYLIFNELYYNTFCSIEDLCKKIYNCDVDKYVRKNINQTVCRLNIKIKNKFMIENIFGKGYELKNVH